MMMQRTHQVTPGFANDLNDAIRENPVAAGLIVLGVIWMVLGGAKVSTLGSKLLGAARTITGAVGPAANATGNAVGEALGGTGTLVKDAARQIAMRFHLLQKAQPHSFGILYPRVRRHRKHSRRPRRAPDVPPLAWCGNSGPPYNRASSASLCCWE